MVAVNPGEVETPVGTLRCTLRAAKAVNTSFGSFTAAFQAVQTLNFNGACVIIAAGLGAKNVGDVEEDVYRTGMPDLVKPLTDYLILLCNGGRPQDDEPATEGSESGKD